MCVSTSLGTVMPSRTNRRTRVLSDEKRKKREKEGERKTMRQMGKATCGLNCHAGDGCVN